jgi:O-antigen ligase
LAAAIVFLANSESVQQSLFVSRFGEIQSDQNLATRLDVQSRALSQIGNWPLGTGIGNLGLGVFGLPVTLSTTDSLYVDYLTGMGWLGLISIIGLLLLIWRALASPERTSMIAKSVLIYGTIFSLSGAGLASNFVSPIFFLIVGLALSATSSDKNDCLDVAMVSDAAYA